MFVYRGIGFSKKENYRYACSVTDPVFWHKRHLVLSRSLLSRFPFSKDHKELLLKIVQKDFECESLLLIDFQQVSNCQQ